MKDKILIVIDMQNDFVTGALANPDAEKIIPNINKLITQFAENGDFIVVTLDTHSYHYLQTQEGRKLPILHCVRGTWGHEMVDEITSNKSLRAVSAIVQKSTFGYNYWRDEINHLCDGMHLTPDHEMEFHLVGTATDICVISNAMLLKAEYPEARIVVYSQATAGTSPEAHQTALFAMASCQIEVDYGDI